MRPRSCRAWTCPPSPRAAHECPAPTRPPRDHGSGASSSPRDPRAPEALRTTASGLTDDGRAVMRIAFLANSGRQTGGATFQPPLQTKVTLGASTELRERLGNDLAEESEVAVIQVEGIGERHDAGVTEEDGPVWSLELLREALEGGEEGDRARLLVDDRRWSADQPCG